MINREITYERTVNRSYMKIPSVPEESFDEKLMLKKHVFGLLPVEKCYVNGAGQYWYNISGRQALDAFCRVNPVGKHFFESLILRFCEQVDLLEWNLMDINCLVVDPELIFVNHNGDDIAFVVYPYNKGDLFMDLQQLMEFLLTKLNHSDVEAVSAAYKIYERILSEGFTISDLKTHILSARVENTVLEPESMAVRKEAVQKPAEAKTIQQQKLSDELQPVKEPQNRKTKLAGIVDERVALFKEKIENILAKMPFELLKAVKDKKNRKDNKKQEPLPTIVYPDEEQEEEVAAVHPTVCIAQMASEPRGVLICEEHGEFPDFQLEKSTCMLGKNPKVQCHLNRETISQFHVRIEYQEGNYYIEDLNSTNGTYVNDTPLAYKQKYCLATGDLLRFADVAYRFY